MWLGSRVADVVLFHFMRLIPGLPHAALASAILACGFLFAAGACSSDDPLSCAEASTLLAQCESADQKGCSDDGEAAALIYSCSSEEKADVFGNGVPGDSCFWNWQCKGDENYSCNHGNCFRRNTVENSCDRGDDDDCLPDLFCADDLTVPEDVDGLCSATEEAVAPALFAETLRAGEALNHQANAAQLLGIMLQTAIDRLNGDDIIRRTFHAKKHTCVRGQFEVLSGIDTDLQVGPVFKTAQTFPAWIRFSNGSIVMDPDEDAALQGLAIKLLGVDGAKLLDDEQPGARTQDFLLIDLPATPTTDANEFVELTQAQFNGNIALAAYLVTHPSVALRALSLTGGDDTTSARTREFWAGGAYRLGDRAMKYVARPCAGAPAASSPSGDDYLRDDLVRVLSNSEVCYDFYIQIQQDSVKQSIEDSSSVWDPALAPERLVARVTIPQTDLTAANVIAEEEQCNDFSFNIWNSAPDYQPLGHVNRGRRLAYEASKNSRGASAEPTAP